MAPRVRERSRPLWAEPDVTHDVRTERLLLFWAEPDVTHDVRTESDPPRALAVILSAFTVAVELCAS